jgi:hypothetical protein
MPVSKKNASRSNRTYGKLNNYGIAFNRELEQESFHRQKPACLLDVPYLEDVFIQDLTNPIPNYEKRGWRPTWSRYTRLTEVNETRPAVLREARELADEEWQDDECDYRDPTAFTNIYK